MEVKNPLIQLKRSESLLRQVLTRLYVNLPIESRVVFVYPGFTLYNADPNAPIILPTQLTAYMKKFPAFESIPSHLIEKMKTLAGFHIRNSDVDKKLIPSYTYEDLKKGTPCAKCHSFSLRIQGQKLKCTLCGHLENLRNVILRLVEEYKLLNPHRTITVTAIKEWGELDINTRRILRVLKSHMEKMGDKRYTYYK